MKKEKNLLTIGEASKFLEVSIDTLRRWDSSGKLKAIKSSGGHRYYSKKELEKFSTDIISLASVWAESKVAPEISSDYHCKTQDIFQARLDKLVLLLDKSEETKDITPLIGAIVGEIGNNSFDHNFGNWPDTAGIFFAYDLNKKIVILADRGVGIRRTLSRIRKDLKDDISSLKVAFTEHISGRQPEHRGNGLKFVRNVVENNPIELSLQSGTAVAKIEKNNGSLKIGLGDRNIKGTLTKIFFK